MKILILGIDGYIGWPLALKQLSIENEVSGMDNFSRRKNVEEMNSHSAIPILKMNERLKKLEEDHGKKISFYEGDLQDYEFIDTVLKETSPDVIVHLAEQPSAPFSMINVQHAVDTQKNNVMGTLNLIYAIKENNPNVHLIKLGTMGEYGYDTGMDIPEGFFDIEYRNKKARIPFPKQAGSWYHWSKVHDSNNIMFACKLWGLRSTDIMQGIVYGTNTNEIKDEKFATRFDFDEAFGTSLNRFCAQAVINYPLTVHGKGGQTRGFLALVDSIQCISLLIENPPDIGEYRVVNQFDQKYSVNELAEMVKKIGSEKGLKVKIEHVENPRKEKEEHYYNAEHSFLKKLGFKHTRELNEELSIMIDDLISNKERIKEKEHTIRTMIKWMK
jgi:UDP-sulfoquinovose synthase